MNRAAVGARPGPGVREALERALDAIGRPVRVADHGPLGVWVEGDTPTVEAIAARWATCGPVRMYVVAAEDARVVTVRAWQLDGEERRALPGASDEAEIDGEEPVAEAVAERLAIALEMFEQLHHEDAHVEVLGK